MITKYPHLSFVVTREVLVWFTPHRYLLLANTLAPLVMGYRIPISIHGPVLICGNTYLGERYGMDKLPTTQKSHLLITTPPAKTLT
ncbi:hypothetical protein EYC84_010088 [Monilinia fructicola]|uniref:Uncharacterized protein n=1 Tax=Monilinia fructicola TaxID=38448 RepID=A0A5M9JBL8_MONFR|nr:hypothetical protein EYC84_010088 [Monilinia fructicola]